MANILLPADDLSGFIPIGKNWVSTLPNGVRGSNLDMLDDIFIAEFNARIRRLLRSGLTAYNRSKYDTASPMGISRGTMISLRTVSYHTHLRQNNCHRRIYAENLPAVQYTSI
jgi:hypothetical protein